MKEIFEHLQDEKKKRERIQNSHNEERDKLKQEYEKLLHQMKLLAKQKRN